MESGNNTGRKRGIVFVLALFFAIAVNASRAGELKFHFIGNMAFHISDGEKELLSDFPYRSGYFGYMKYEMKDVPPIKDGLCLITHFHADHWEKNLFLGMKNVTLMAPQTIAGLVETEHKVAFGEQMDWKGIHVEAIKTQHRLAPDHYSYLVTWHGLRIYFPGDTETPAHLLQMKNLDVCFISPWLIRTIARQNLHLDTKKLVVYHQKPVEEIPPFQNYLRLEQGQEFTVPYADDAAPGSKP